MLATKGFGISIDYTCAAVILSNVGGVRKRTIERLSLNDPQIRGRIPEDCMNPMRILRSYSERLACIMLVALEDCVVTQG